MSYNYVLPGEPKKQESYAHDGLSLIVACEKLKFMITHVLSGTENTCFYTPSRTDVSGTNITEHNVCIPRFVFAIDAAEGFSQSARLHFNNSTNKHDFSNILLGCVCPSKSELDFWSQHNVHGACVRVLVHAHVAQCAELSNQRPEKY